MENAMLVTAEGMNSMANANYSVETGAVGDLAITMIPVALKLTEECLTKMNQDHWEYFTDLEDVVSGQDPAAAAAASAAYGQYEVDSSELSSSQQGWDTEQSVQKQFIGGLEQANPYSMMEAFQSLPQATINILMNG